MSYILAMKFAMIPGAAVQDYSLRSQTMIQIRAEALRIQGTGCGTMWARTVRTAYARRENKYRYASANDGEALLRPLLPGAVGAQGELAEASSIADEQHRVLITGAFNIL
ncbi:hypothetical protein OA42_01905 [Klebsiella michiganensis]|nr:hypothetical protein OA42_01905 [Klebsiella michiganensis]